MAETDNVIKLQKMTGLPIPEQWVRRAGQWGAEQIAGLLARSLEAERLLAAERERVRELVEELGELASENPCRPFRTSDGPGWCGHTACLLRAALQKYRAGEGGKVE